MKFSFTMKVPMADRWRILWQGGLHISVDYKGQHKVAKCIVNAMPEKEVSENVEKESTE